ncbi:MAG TPA: FkbM family methyltransferase [Lacunisphaera sp.]|nr:FkbM family methyltransferase [Lacunisphaera sp.]
MSFLKERTLHVRLPIKRGPNQGRLWSISTAKNYFYDRFVPGKAACLPQLLREGETVWDIGAHCGYTALIESRVVGPQGRCVAFEPNPRNRRLLELHLKWNHVGNVTVLPYAVSGSDGELSFGWEDHQRASSISSHLGGAGWKVPVRQIDGLIASGEVPAPTALKIDVEGAELELLRGAARLLANQPELLIILSTHTAELHDGCCALLRAAGFTIVETSAVAVARTEGWASLGDVDLLAYRPERGVSPAAQAAFAAIGRAG